MDSSIVAIIISLVVIILFITNKVPMSFIAMGGSVAMAILIPEMKLSQAYAGFSATGWQMTVGMLIVSASLFETGVAQSIGKKISNSFFVKQERLFIITISIICTLMSAFMSNNGTVAIWMPIIAVIASGSKGKIRSKMVIFVAGTAAVVGGGTTLIGSTSQLVANSVLQSYEGYEEGMKVFDMSKIMLPVCIVQVLFWATIGYTLLKKVLKPESPDFDRDNMYATAPVIEDDIYKSIPRYKRIISIGTMLLCVFLFVTSGFNPLKNYFNIGIIGMLGGCIIIVTGCIPVKKAYSELPWDILFTIGGIAGIGTGLEVSGGGALIANSVLNLFGGQQASIMILTAVIAVLTSVLTNFMQNNATAAMLTPICISMALEMQISPFPWVILIGATSNFAIATSYGTAVNLQILPAGYKFSDFIKIGGPLLIIMIITVVISSLLFLF